VDPAEARQLFIRHALVEGDWQTRHRFYADNAALRESLSALEARERRALVDDDAIHAFYDSRIPPSVVSARHFDAWWKKARHRTPDLLTMKRSDLLTAPVDDAHPTTWRAGDLALPVTYRFDPGSSEDGVTVHVPVDVLARLGGADFSWQVPALREELVTALIRSLPKELRRAFVPAPDIARAVLAAMDPGHEPLLHALQRELHRQRGVLVPLDAFDLGKLPAHLRVTFAVEDADGAEIARGKELDVLQAELAAEVKSAVTASVAEELARHDLTAWPDDLLELPRVVERSSAGHLIRGFPAFVDEGATVSIQVFPSEAEQRATMPAGVRRLLRLGLPSPVKAVERTLSSRARLVLSANPDGSPSALLDDCADAAVDALLGAVPWTRQDFEATRARIAGQLVPRTASVVALVERVLAAAHEVRSALPADPPDQHRDAVHDVREQFRRLLPAGFVRSTGEGHLADLARYVSAIARRLDRLARDPETDGARMIRVRAVQDAYDKLVRALPQTRAAADDVRDIARLIEEFRVSLWAQQLGTSRPVSEQRIFRAIDAIAP
jgi:ATP-dependent helicase HrpA